MSKSVVRYLFLFFFIQSSCLSHKANDPAPKGPYFPKVKTIIANNCLACHSASGSWMGRPVALDTDDEITAAAETIKRAVAGPTSLTIKKMPQGGTLSQSDIDTIVAWYDAGGRATD